MIRLLAALPLILTPALLAQQLEPRSYSPSPVGINIGIAGYGYSAGDLNFDPSLPVDNGSARINAFFTGYFRSLNVAGRSANVTVAVPYALGHIQGNYFGDFTRIYRSGFADAFTRFAINLHGAPAMQLKEFARYRQKTNIGASVVVSAPTGQYDPNKLINVGTNRWAFKPELGVSHAVRNTRLVMDGYFGVWLYTANNDFQGRTRTQNPIASAQAHLSYDLRPGLWAAFDANFFRGGRTAIDGAPRQDFQTNSRIGGTISFPVAKRQSLKFTYSLGAYTTIGGDFQSVGVSYQYLWGAGL